MKHLKTFEATIEDDHTKLKKYIIYYSKELLPTYQIIEILYTEPYRDNSKIKFWYQSINNNEIEKSSKLPYTTSTNYLIKNTIYQSDNLQDCIDKLEIMIHTYKYNL